MPPRSQPPSPPDPTPAGSLQPVSPYDPVPGTTPVVRPPDTLASRLKRYGVKGPAEQRYGTTPVWAGPNGSGPNGGITFSSLSRFLVDRERFRVRMVEGLAPADGFNHSLEYGHMWHVCEEALAASAAPDVKTFSWEPLKVYVRGLVRKYPNAGEKIQHWYRCCLAQFPAYVEYWRDHPDVKDRVPLLQEYPFDVPYTLPSGRVVRLRGKMDSTDLIREECPACRGRGLKPKHCNLCQRKGRREGIFLQENKTKGDLREEVIQRQLKGDLQTNLYLTALEALLASPVGEEEPEGLTKLRQAGAQHPVLGVRYNVIRRPLSGGRHSIRPHAATAKKPAETSESFFARLEGLIRDDASYFFMRWKVLVTKAERERFRKETLHPVLEALCDWWEGILYATRNNTSPFRGGTFPTHWRHPYGVYNVLDEGGCDDLDEYLDTRNAAGLRRREVLFPELTTEEEVGE